MADPTEEQILAGVKTLIDNSATDYLTALRTIKAQMVTGKAKFAAIGVPPKISKCEMYVDNAIMQLEQQLAGT